MMFLMRCFDVREKKFKEENFVLDDFQDNVRKPGVNPRSHTKSHFRNEKWIERTVHRYCLSKEENFRKLNETYITIAVRQFETIRNISSAVYKTSKD